MQGKLECGSPEVASRQLQLALERLPAAPAWVRTALAPEESALWLDTAGCAPETNQGGGVSNTGEAGVLLTLLM
jgi:hypothetical protein